MQGTHHQHVDALDEKGTVASVDDMVDALSHIIHKISCEVVLKAGTKQCSSFSILFMFCLLSCL